MARLCAVDGVVSRCSRGSSSFVPVSRLARLILISLNPLESGISGGNFLRYIYRYVYISINKFQVNVEVARASHIKGSTLVCSQTNVELGLIACLKCMHVITDLCPCVQTRVSSLVV